eukprot:2890992-Pyramimonas_sp.AAC.1
MKSDAKFTIAMESALELEKLITDVEGETQTLFGFHEVPMKQEAAKNGGDSAKKTNKKRKKAQ